MMFDPVTSDHTRSRRSIFSAHQVRCVVLSERRDFAKVGAISDVWLPELRLWAGEYPFLLRPAFEDLCKMRLRKSS